MAAFVSKFLPPQLEKSSYAYVPNAYQGRNVKQQYQVPWPTCVRCCRLLAICRARRASIGGAGVSERTRCGRSRQWAQRGWNGRPAPYTASTSCIVRRRAASPDGCSDCSTLLSSSPERQRQTPDTWAEKFESFERINSIRETNGNFDSCNSCKRLDPSRRGRYPISDPSRIATPPATGKMVGQKCPKHPPKERQYPYRQI